MAWRFSNGEGIIGSRFYTKNKCKKEQKSTRANVDSKYQSRNDFPVVFLNMLKYEKVTFYIKVLARMLNSPDIFTKQRSFWLSSDSIAHRLFYTKPSILNQFSIRKLLTCWVWDFGRRWDWIYNTVLKLTCYFTLVNIHFFQFEPFAIIHLNIFYLFIVNPLQHYIKMSCSIMYLITVPYLIFFSNIITFLFRPISIFTDASVCRFEHQGVQICEVLEKQHLYKY